MSLGHTEALLIAADWDWASEIQGPEAGSHQKRINLQRDKNENKQLPLLTGWLVKKKSHLI